jgi:hypothetical protein
MKSSIIPIFFGGLGLLILIASEANSVGTTIAVIFFILAAISFFKKDE